MWVYLGRRHWRRSYPRVAKGHSWSLSRGGLFFSSRRRHTRFDCDWSSDVCSSDLSVLEGRTYTARATSILSMRPQMTGGRGGYVRPYAAGSLVICAESQENNRIIGSASSTSWGPRRPPAYDYKLKVRPITSISERQP